MRRHNGCVTLEETERKVCSVLIKCVGEMPPVDLWVQNIGPFMSQFLVASLLRGANKKVLQNLAEMTETALFIQH